MFHSQLFLFAVNITDIKNEPNIASQTFLAFTEEHNIYKPSIMTEKICAPILRVIRNLSTDRETTFLFHMKDLLNLIPQNTYLRVTR